MTKKIPYFPGCTLTKTAKNFDLTAREVMTELGLELEELPKWNCCGTVSSLATDNIMNHLASVRIIIRAQENGSDKLTTLCSMCYNTLKRSNLLVKNNPDKLEKINSFMEEEQDYKGGVEVLHTLELIRDEIGLDKVKKKVKKSLNGLKLVPYYGCLLTRPKEIAIDDVEMPTVMDNLLQGLGAEIVYDPYLTECCGSYHTVKNKEVVVDKAKRIIGSAQKRGADAIITSCPLCHFNLDERQRKMGEKYPEIKKMPILYFTQVMALSFGLKPEICNFDIHFIDPKPMLKGKGIL